MNTNSYLRLLLMVLADALAKLRSRIQSDPTLHRILVVFVTGLVLRIKGQPFLVKPITLPRLIPGIEESQSKTGVKK
jgi:hypothetical protein